MLAGGAGNDLLTGGVGNDTLNGGYGRDTAGFGGATGGVTVNLAVTRAQAIGGGQGTDLLTGIENINGSRHGDRLDGSAGDNTLYGAGGADVLHGAAGTVQEIFQSITPLYYAEEDRSLAPLVLVGVDHWSREVPVWPAIQSLGRDRGLGRVVHLVDSVEEAAELVLSSRG